MGREEMVLYVADHACEGRRDPEVPHWRVLAHEDLERATLAMLTHLLTNLLCAGVPLWPPTVLARNYLLLRRQEDACSAKGQVDTTQRKPILPVELSGVLPLRAATR
jgi:hypothetical protein